MARVSNARRRACCCVAPRNRHAPQHSAEELDTRHGASAGCSTLSQVVAAATLRMCSWREEGRSEWVRAHADVSGRRCGARRVLALHGRGARTAHRQQQQRGERRGGRPERPHARDAFGVAWCFCLGTRRAPARSSSRRTRDARAAAAAGCQRRSVRRWPAAPRQPGSRTARRGGESTCTHETADGRGRWSGARDVPSSLPARQLAVNTATTMP
jgi:hypothetical protein